MNEKKVRTLKDMKILKIKKNYLISLKKINWKNWGDGYWRKLILTHHWSKQYTSCVG